MEWFIYFNILFEEKLDANKVAIKFHPKNPGVDEDVIFSANLNYSNVSH